MRLRAPCAVAPRRAIATSSTGSTTRAARPGRGRRSCAARSARSPREVGHPTYHADDWESVQFRIRPDGTADVRASAHYGYGDGWQPADESSYTVAGGSHAGTVEPAEFDRITTPRRLGLIPLEPIAEADPQTEFAITPPWHKRVWLDPEYGGTD